MKQEKKVETAQNDSNHQSQRQRGRDQERPCGLCDQSGHKLSKCLTYDTCEKKVDRLIELNRCCRCARRSHTAENCQKRNLSCRKCRGKHFEFLCLTRNQEVENRQRRSNLSELYQLPTKKETQNDKA